MANIMSMVKLKNKASRNGFDLSRKNAFTAKVGELLPVTCIECLPGDSYDIEVQHFTRTRPVNTAAYTRIREYFDWYFVPTNLMWNKFNTVFTRMLDNGQHAQGITENTTLSTSIPYTSINKIKNYLTRAKGTNNLYGYDKSALSSKLLSYLGYGDLSFASNDPYTDVNSTLKNLSVNLFPLLAYQKIYQDYYRNSQWEKAYAPSWNLDYIKGTNDLEIPIDDLDPTDNVENMFDLRYRNWNKDMFMGVLPSAQYGAAASVNTSGVGSVVDRIPVMSPAEYGDGWQVQLQSLYAVGANNMPYYTNASGSTASTQKKYLAYQDDGNNSGNWQTYFNINAQQVQDLRSKLGLSDAYIDGAYFNNSSSGSFTILQLRLAEAQQMMNEITQSVGQDFKSQMEAHWNVSVSDVYSERCRYIGGSVSNLDISEVINTNITGTNEASIAGKGVGVGRSKEKFTTDVPGYLVCIYSAVPLLDYSITGVKRMCTRTETYDFAIPEFDAVGMEPLGIEQLINSVFTTRVPSSEELIQTLGYVPRYIDYKTAYDEVNGGFRKQQDGLNDWVAPLTNQYFEEYLYNISLNGVGSADSLTYHFFKVNPNVLDPIFDINADYSVSTDQLWVNSAFDIKAVRKLDRNGLPY